MTRASEHPGSHGATDAFATTHWSLVAALGDPAASRASLGELCLRYWYPVYAHVRRIGRDAAASGEITSAFFSGVVGEARPGVREVEGGFRGWLFARLNAFLGRPPEDLSGQAVLEAPSTAAELEARFEAETGAATPPDAAFQRSFALELMSQANARLRQEARDARRAEMFEALEPYLTTDPPPGRYEELGRALAMQPISVAMALKRLRGRFRELVDKELVDTVTTSADFRAERDVLKAALSGNA